MNYFVYSYFGPKKPKSSHVKEQLEKVCCSSFELDANGSIQFYQRIHEYRQTETPVFRYNDSIDCPLRISAILIDYLHSCPLNKSTIISQLMLLT